MIQRQPEPREEKSLGELFGELTQELATLVRQELDLAKTEMSEKLGHITAQVGLIAAGGALAYAGVLAIVAAIVLLLGLAGLPLWLSALIVGIVVACIGGGLVYKAIGAIRHADMTPRQTVQTLRQLKEDIQ